MARCPNCGSDNPGYALYCGKCGHEVPKVGMVDQGETEQRPPAKERTPEAPIEATKPTYEKKIDMRTCAGCWRAVESSFPFCPFCGRPMESQPVNERGVNRIWDTSYSPAVERISASGILVAGGVLAILAGVLALGQGILYGTVYSIIPAEYTTGLLCLCSGLGVLFGIGSILGGIFAIMRKSFGLAVFGAVLGILGLGFVIGSVFGILAVILIAVSKQEFES